MKNIVNIVNNTNKNSLILLDELGSGTDPLEGANLAISILDYLKNLGSLTIATTHYQELKKYALVTNGFENASVEFDITTLSPTYKLLVGIPGKSNAFEISKKLGLDDSIISKAKSLLTNDEINIEELLKSIYDDKSFIEKEKEKIKKQSEEISKLKQSLEHDNFELLKQEQELINNAKVKARNILLDAKEEASDIIKQMNELSDTKELNKLKNKLNTDIKNISIINNINDNSSKTINSLKPEEIEPNTTVFVNTLNQNGTVISHISKSNEVQVQVGNIKMSVNIKYLEKAKTSNNSNPKNQSNSSNNLSNYTKISKTRTAKPEINVIGLNVEEAIFVVDKFLDDSTLAKLSTVRIVHGKGTGKLRLGIQEFLKKNPHVKSYRIGTYGEGEMGVTVVELK